MKTLFDPADRDSLEARIQALGPANKRHWGKMTAAQMLCHCGRPLELAIGDHPMKQALIGKILAPFIRKSILGEKPFGRNSPTDPTFIVADEREIDTERDRLLTLIRRFVERGPDAAAKETHSFFGKLSGAEWGQLMYKHIDHHLQQFEA